jgi:hypothetical protein
VVVPVSTGLSLDVDRSVGLPPLTSIDCCCGDSLLLFVLLFVVVCGDSLQW